MLPWGLVLDSWLVVGQNLAGGFCILFTCFLQCVPLSTCRGHVFLGLPLAWGPCLLPGSASCLVQVRLCMPAQLLTISVCHAACHLWPDALASGCCQHQTALPACHVSLYRAVASQAALTVAMNRG